MKKKSLFFTITSMVVCLLLCSCGVLWAEDSPRSTTAGKVETAAKGNYTVYVTTLSTGFSTIGSKHSISALFYKSANADSEWNFLGHNNRIFDVAFFGPSEGKIIALATHTGVHQSWDYGKTWKTTSGWQMTEVNDVEFDPENSDILYASSPYGFYKTIDNGKTWKQYNEGLVTPDETFVSSILIDKRDRNKIFITTEGGLYESTTAGESWTRVKNITFKHLRKIVQNPHNPENFALCTEDNGLYMSEDGGKIWEKSDVGLLSKTIYGFTFDENNPDIMYAVGFLAGVYKSVNGGKTWKQYFQGLGTLTIRAITVMPGNSNIVYAGTLGKGIYVSEDQGENWKFAGIDNGFVTTIKIENFKENK